MFETTNEGGKRNRKSLFLTWSPFISKWIWLALTYQKVAKNGYSIDNVKILSFKSTFHCYPFISQCLTYRLYIPTRMYKSNIGNTQSNKFYYTVLVRAKFTIYLYITGTREKQVHSPVLVVAVVFDGQLHLFLPWDSAKFDSATWEKNIAHLNSNKGEQKFKFPHCLNTNILI